MLGVWLSGDALGSVRIPALPAMAEGLLRTHSGAREASSSTNEEQVPQVRSSEDYRLHGSTPLEGALPRSQVIPTRAARVARLTLCAPAREVLHTNYGLQELRPTGWPAEVRSLRLTCRAAAENPSSSAIPVCLSSHLLREPRCIPLKLVHSRTGTSVAPGPVPHAGSFKQEPHNVTP
jgi:hypothetical protein